jgi:hypothetical protein
VRRYLTETERANGFANRFLWLLVRRPIEGRVGDELVASPIRTRPIHDLRLCEIVAIVGRSTLDSPERKRTTPSQYTSACITSY